MGNVLSVIGIIAFIIIAIILGVAFKRNVNMSYRTGKGLFENSEYNMEDKKDISDMEYYDGDGGLFK